VEEGWGKVRMGEWDKGGREEPWGGGGGGEGAKGRGGETEGGGGGGAMCFFRTDNIPNGGLGRCLMCKVRQPAGGGCAGLSMASLQKGGGRGERLCNKLIK